MSRSQRTVVRLAWAWGPALAYTALIWFVSSLSHTGLSLDHVPWRDKGVHFLEYAILGLLVARAVDQTWPSLGRALSAGLGLVAASVWGVIDEIHQAYVPGRSADAEDVTADVLGALAGVSLWWVWRWIGDRRRGHQKKPLEAERGSSATSSLE